MYMYYLLGYRLCGAHDDQLWKGAKDANAKDQRRKTQFAPGSIFKYLPEEIARKVRYMNTAAKQVSCNCFPKEIDRKEM